MPEEQKAFNEPSKDIEKNKRVAVLAYCWILCVIPLWGYRRSKFAQFHARQGVVLLGLSLFTVVPFFGQILMLVLIVLSVLGAIKAWDGAWFKLPLIYDMSKKIKDCACNRD